MKNLVIIILFGLICCSVSFSQSSGIYIENDPVESALNNIDNQVLVFINGLWWWITYNEDGSIRTQIPADF